MDFASREAVGGLGEVVGRVLPVGDQVILQQEAKDQPGQAYSDLTTEQEAGTGYGHANAAMSRDHSIANPEKDVCTPSEREKDIRAGVADTIETLRLGLLTRTEIGHIVDQSNVAGGGVLAALEQESVRSHNNDSGLEGARKPSAGEDTGLSGPPFGGFEEAGDFRTQEGRTGTVGED